MAEKKKTEKPVWIVNASIKLPAVLFVIIDCFLLGGLNIRSFAVPVLSFRMSI
jgi:hypothetical protein